MEAKQKWYQKNAWIIAFLIIFFPIGLILMWRFANWDKRIKWGITVFFIILYIFIHIQGDSQNKKSAAVHPEFVCIGPDGKRIGLSQKACDDFNNAWKNKKNEEANSITFVFDAPSLLGKNIDEIRSVLGEPADGALKEPTAQQIKLGGTQWDNTFKKDNKELLVTFDAKTRKVVDLFISTDDSSGVTNDTSHLLQMGNLEANNSKYTVTFVKAVKDSSVFTGVKVTPN